MSSSLQLSKPAFVDEAVLMKPVSNKRSLSSILSIDNHSDETNQESIGNLSAKRRKLNVDSKWELKDLPELPFLYLKEKTSVVVLNANPQDIASRIVDCAKSLSAYGHYNGEKAKASLNANNVEFSVQLFKVTERTNKCVIVEMQRTNGSSIQFHKVAQTLLKVAKETQAQSPPAPSPSFTNKGDINKLQRLRKNNREKKERNQEEVFTCTLEMVDALLKKDRVDANLLGMESLQLLTSHKSASDSMVKFVSDIVVTGERFGDIKGTISSLITKYTIDGDTPTNDVEEGYYRKMRVCALTVLSNSLKSFFDLDKTSDAKTDTCKIDSILSSDDWLGDHGLLTLLIGELKNAKVEPNDAYLAGRSLEIVFLRSLRMRSEAIKLNAQTIITESLELGQASYPLLEPISKNLLKILMDEGKNDK